MIQYCKSWDRYLAKFQLFTHVWRSTSFTRRNILPFFLFCFFLTHWFDLSWSFRWNVSLLAFLTFLCFYFRSCIYYFLHSLNFRELPTLVFRYILHILRLYLHFLFLTLLVILFLMLLPLLFLYLLILICFRCSSFNPSFSTSFSLTLWQAMA